MAIIRKHWKAAAFNAVLLVLCAVAVMYGIFSHGGRVAAHAGEAVKEAAIKPTPPAIPRIDPNANAGVKSVAEAHRTGKHPERLSHRFLPEPFDKAKFQANPQAYLDVVEPGRVWQTAEPSKDMTPLVVVGKEMVAVAPGASVQLAVTGVPHAPVTFTSFDGGAFDNQLGSITVQADAKGEAHVTFTATAGTDAVVNISAGSPLAVDVVRFWVSIQKPKQ